MPKKFLLSELFSILESSQAPVGTVGRGAAGGASASTPAATDNYFLFMMGTGGKFQENPEPLLSTGLPPAEKPYVRGETLSYSAQALVTLLDESAQALKGTAATEDTILSYSSPSVDVLDGPSNTGGDVGERIARGVFLALRAAASGKKTLQIAGHSRGAVESILIMHELDRIKREIKQALTTPAATRKKFKDIVCNSENTRSNLSITTKMALEQLFQRQTAEEYPEQLLRKLDAQLDALKINAFLIDPVPGDAPQNVPLPLGSFFTWKDDLFYKKIPCDAHELLLCRDEQSPSFYPIIPNDAIVIVQPGHHGTGCGNPYSQNVTKPDDPAYNTDHTKLGQDLALLKFFNFIKKSTGLFTEPTHSELSIGTNKELDTVLIPFLRDPESSDKQILDKYEEVSSVKAAFQPFTRYSYLSPIGAETYRSVHRHQAAYTRLDDFVPPRDSRFLNLEHADLMIGQLTGFKQAKVAPTVAEQVATIQRALTGIISLMRSTATTAAATEAPAQTAASPRDAGDSFTKLLEDKTSRGVFFAALSTLVNSISEKYLSNKLDVHERQNLMEAVCTVFAMLQDAKSTLSDSSAHTGMLTECQRLFQQGIKETLEKHCTTTIEQTKELTRNIEYFLARPEKLSNDITSFCDKFSSNCDASLLEWARGVALHLNNPIPRTIVRLKELLTAEAQQISSSGLEIAEQEKRTRALFGDLYREHLEPYIRAQDTSLQDYFLNLEQKHAAANELLSIYRPLGAVVVFDVATTMPAPASAERQTSGIHLTIDQHALECVGRDLAHFSGILLKEKTDLFQKPDNMSDGFYAIAREQARILPEAQATITALAAQTALTAEAQAQLAAVQAQLAAANQSIRTSQSDDERVCRNIIHDELQPLILDYLRHLRQQAHKYNRNLNVQDCTERQLGNIRPRTQTYSDIQRKYAIVRSMYENLISVDVTPIPYRQRITNFHEAIEANKDNILLNRDPMWLSCVKACAAVLAIIGIIVTGILPGMVAMEAYTGITGKKPLFFSTRSEEFVKQTEENRELLPPPPNGPGAG